MRQADRLVAFDLDGTLIDSERDLADAVNALLAERGAPPLSEEAIGEMVGNGAGVLVRRAFTAAGVSMDESSLPRFLALYGERLTQTTRPYDGILEVLGSLRGSRTCVVLTNKPTAYSRRLLEALELAPFFATVIGGDGPFPRKPDPAALLHLMQVHGAAADATVMVGDSQVDAATAAAAGTHFCLADYGFGARTIAPGDLRPQDIRIGRPQELLPALSRLIP